MNQGIIFLASIAGLLIAVPSIAQRQTSGVPSLDEGGRKGEMARLAQKKAEDKFDAADEDKNGMLSRAEVAKYSPYINENFDKYDKNKDGSLSWEEFIGHDRWKRQSVAK